MPLCFAYAKSRFSHDAAQKWVDRYLYKNLKRDDDLRGLCVIAMKRKSILYEMLMEETQNELFLRVNGEQLYLSIFKMD